MEMNDPGLALPKDGKAPASLDRAESVKVQKRSRGRCEVIVKEQWAGLGEASMRCCRKATQVHHMIGGRGKRGVGISALKEHKQHVCDVCHRAIGGGIGGKQLNRVGGAVPFWTDWYERAK